jgi:hypothetical protein
MSSKSDHQQCGDLTYRPYFLSKSENVDDSILRTNKEEGDLIDGVDLARITTGWIHRILHHVGTVKRRESEKACFSFQPKFSEK